MNVHVHISPVKWDNNNIYVVVGKGLFSAFGRGNGPF